MNKKLIENFCSLSVLNITNYIFPVVIIPFLTNRLGSESYGRYAFSLSIIHYFILIIQYGFDLSATRDIALHSEHYYRQNIYSTVMFIKLVFNILFITFLVLMISVIPLMNSDGILYIYGVGIIVGQTLCPFWFFQGIEKMKFITIANFVIRLIPLLLIILYVKDSADGKYVMLFQSIGFMAGMLFSLLVVRFEFKLKFVIPQKKMIQTQLKKGWHRFISTIGMNFYRESNVVILGIFTNFESVAMYAPAEKLIKAAQSLTTPFVNTLYPYFSRRFFDDRRDNALTLFYKVGKYYAYILGILVVGTILIAPYLSYLLGESYTMAIGNLRIMSFVVILGGMNFYYGIIGLVNKGGASIFAKGVWIAGLISIISCIVMVNIIGSYGASVSMVLAELILYIYIKHYGKLS